MPLNAFGKEIGNIIISLPHFGLVFYFNFAIYLKLLNWPTDMRKSLLEYSIFLLLKIINKPQYLAFYRMITYPIYGYI